MDTSFPRDRKVTVPSPLPTRRSDLYIPPALSDSVTEALVSTDSAIPQLQVALKSALHKEKWDAAVRAHILDILRTPEGERTSDDKVLSAVVKTIMSGPKTRGIDQANTEENGHANIEIPQAAVDAAVKFVRGQLDTVCAVVDYVDWDGVEG